MNKTIEANGNVLLADKNALRQIIEEQSALMGFEYDPNATPEDSQRMILEDGVQPEDNLFSCGIILAREE